MATLTLTFDTGAATVASIVDDLAAANGYQATIPDPANPGQTLPNPQTKAAFAKEMVRQYIVRTIRDYRKEAAAKLAREAAAEPTLI